MDQTRSRGPKLIESLLAAWLMAATLVSVEVLVVTAVFPDYARILGQGNAPTRIFLAYGTVYGLLGFLAWLLSLPLRRLKGARSRAFDLLACLSLLPVASYALFVPYGSRRPLMREPRLALFLALVWLCATVFLCSRKRSSGLVAWLRSSLLWAAPGLCAAWLLRHSYPLTSVPARPLVPGSWAFAGWITAVPLALGLVCATLLGSLPERVSTRRLAACLGAALALFVAFVGFFPGTIAARPRLGAPREGRPNILWIVVDTLRADHVAGFGGVPNDTPNLAALAKEAVLFPDCQSTAPWTVPSFGSMFTSRYPSEHGCGARYGKSSHGARELDLEARTVAEALAENGYQTSAVLANNNVSSFGIGLERGFERWCIALAPEHYHLLATWLGALGWAPFDIYLTAEPQTSLLREELRQLASKDDPWMLLAHYQDPHLPYLAPEEYYAPGTDDSTLAGRYRAEVRRTDQGLGRLFTEMRQLGMWDDALVILTADHGEEIDENREGRKRARQAGRHGHTLHHELLNVPLVIKLPGGAQGGTLREEPVSLIDLAPTIIAQAGGERVPGFRGWNLFDEERPTRAFEERVLVSEAIKFGAEQKAGFEGGTKLVVRRSPPAAKFATLFDRTQDPLELAPGPADPKLEAVQNIIAALRLQGELFASHPSGDGGANRELTPAQEEQLQALGYIDKPEE